MLTVSDHVARVLVGELIELVLLKGGDAVIVPAGDLADHEHLAAVLRY
jgi:hypothetical protein